ncbi:TIGR03936 family radical SAM-associated protein [uncultured Robinsoniella sp.]|uniref:TIGR03936 family radical SAM-associated protein n=1 Tax=uncultured Robinsoniella sp. TaxID=904190 RepID=UPI00374F6003
MKVRIKFAKEGVMKFIGHLDIMRYFQKAMRRGNIDIAFTEGFSPHMIMSFAAPLGVGLTSTGEYLDIEVNTEISSADAIRQLNACMVEGMSILSFRRIPEEKASKAMSLVAAADYLVNFREENDPGQDYKSRLQEFYNRESITVVKKTKKSEKEVDIKPMIYALELRDEGIFMQLATGSVNNLKPELVMEAFSRYLGMEPEPFGLMVHRLEVYADLGNEKKRRLVSLEDLGEDIPDRA